jgi:tetratricopeptide (TPR) repeat protein
VGDTRKIAPALIVDHVGGMAVDGQERFDGDDRGDPGECGGKDEKAGHGGLRGERFDARSLPNRAPSKQGLSRPTPGSPASAGAGTRLVADASEGDAFRARNAERPVTAILRLVAILAAIFLWQLPGAAQERQTADRDWDDCASADGARSMRGCTAVLDRGARETATNRSLALIYRGTARGSRAELELDAALADYNEAIRAPPTSAAAYHARAALRAARGDLDGALVDYTQAIRLDPRNPATLHGRGMVHFQRGDLDAALAGLNEAIRLDPGNEAVLRDRAVVIERRGR